MNRDIFLEYLEICTDALKAAIKETNIEVDMNAMHYEYIILHIFNIPDSCNEKFNVSDNKKMKINAEFLNGGYGFLKNIYLRASNQRLVYNKSVKKYVQDNGLDFCKLERLAHEKIKFLSHNNDLAVSDIEYISCLVKLLSEGKNNRVPVRNFWIAMLSALFMRIQNHGSEGTTALNESYKIVMLSELSRIFAKYSDIFSGITEQEDGFYAAAALLYFKLFLISAMNEKTVDAAASFIISPVSVFAAEDCRRCKLTPVLLDSVFASSSNAEKKCIEMTEALIVKASELEPDKIDFDEFHVLFGNTFFSIANNNWCQGKVIFPLLDRCDESALRFSKFYKKAVEKYRKNKWLIPAEMYTLDRAYAAFRAERCINCKIPEIEKHGMFRLSGANGAQDFMILRHTSGLSRDEFDKIKRINSGEGDSSYAKNYSYFIKATDEELKIAARKGDLYTIVVEANGKRIIVGFSIMTVETDTSDEKNRTPYNGGKMKEALEQSGIEEKDYGVLNTIIIDPAYYGYGLQQVVTLLLIRLCLNKKKYVVATVSNRNRFSYQNFMRCCFTDIDDGNELGGSVLYEIKKNIYPRHLVLLKINEHSNYTHRLDILAFLSYAKLFHEMHNENYIFYSGRNCQNFVSQCLVAAGWEFSDIFYPQSLAFINIAMFKDYAVGMGIEYIERFDGISQGNLLVTDNCKHIMIVQAVNRVEEKITIYAAGNTNNRDMFNVDLKLITGYLRTSVLF